MIDNDISNSRLLLLSHGARLVDISMLQWIQSLDGAKKLPATTTFGDTQLQIKDLHRRRPVTKDKWPAAWALEDSANFLGLPTSQLHRAGPDAQLTWEVMYHSLDRYGDDSLTPRQQLVGRFFDQDAKSVLSDMDEKNMSVGRAARKQQSLLAQQQHNLTELQQQSVLGAAGATNALHYRPKSKKQDGGVAAASGEAEGKSEHKKEKPSNNQQPRETSAAASSEQQQQQQKWRETSVLSPDEERQLTSGVFTMTESESDADMANYDKHVIDADDIAKNSVQKKNRMTFGMGQEALDAIRKGGETAAVHHVEKHDDGGDSPLPSPQEN